MTATDRPIYLVTGAGGLVGSHMVRHLADRGIAVRAMVRKPAQAEALRGIADEVAIGDLTAPDTLPAAVAGVSGIYHIAAMFREEKGRPDLFFEANVEGTRHLLDAAIAAGVPRLVNCSTNGVHSDIDNPPADETYPFNPGDPYQVSKLEAEMLASRYFAEGRIRGVSIRPTMIWGPGDTRILKMFRMIAKGRFFYVGKGQALTHWVDVRDLVQAFRLAMEAESLNDEAFLVGGARYQPLREVAEEIARQLGVRPPRIEIPVGPMMAVADATEAVCKPFGIAPPLYRRRVAFFVKNRAYDISKARRRLGYEPAQDLSGEIRDIIADYRAEGLI